MKHDFYEIFMKRDFYVMKDYLNEGETLQIRLAEPNELTRLNEQGYGVFWTVNEFQGKPRKKENLTRLNSYFFEIDQGSKLDQMKKIDSGLEPSMIVETKRGYHVYFDIFDCDGDLENYRSVLVDRLIPFYGADVRASDVCRILRVPFFYHQKDPNDKFMVTLVKQSRRKYTQKEIEKIYKNVNEKAKEERLEFKSTLSFQDDDDLFFRIYNMNQAEALQRLSGTEAVGMEKITFRHNNSGLQIFVNGKSTSSWIDKNFKIGSYDRGGPTFYQWIKWYHGDDKVVYQFVKKYFPELIQNAKR